jgi:hypothetical protein
MAAPVVRAGRHAVSTARVTNLKRHLDNLETSERVRRGEAERLGHRKIGTTLDTYAHVLPSMQRDAARQLAALLHRR